MAFAPCSWVSSCSLSCMSSVFVATAQAQWDTDSTGKISFDNFVQGQGRSIDISNIFKQACVFERKEQVSERPGSEVVQSKYSNLLFFALQGVNQMRHRIRALQGPGWLTSVSLESCFKK